jgi:GcrA cell cycle regulator
MMRFASDPFDWNDENVRRLETLWAEGHSTAEIGRRMGVTKNAIVGKAHRLNLPARPSPIRAEAERKLRQPRRAPRVTLPGVQPPPTRTKASHVTRPLPAPPTWRAAEHIKLGVSRCCWPIGDPGTPEFRFCEATNAAGYAYCPDHCAIAYRPTTGRAAAA